MIEKLRIWDWSVILRQFLQGGFSFVCECFEFAEESARCVGSGILAQGVAGAAKEIIGGDTVIFAGPADKAESRLTCTVFIMAQQRLANAQVSCYFPLTVSVAAAQIGERRGKGTFHVASLPFQPVLPAI